MGVHHEEGRRADDHTHDDVGEIFYILEGSLTIRCGDEQFEVSDGGFVFLPRNAKHGYTIHSDGPVRFLGLSAPSDFGDHLEATGKLLTESEAQAKRDALMRLRQP